MTSDDVNLLVDNNNNYNTNSNALDNYGSLSKETTMPSPTIKSNGTNFGETEGASDALIENKASPASNKEMTKISEEDELSSSSSSSSSAEHMHPLKIIAVLSTSFAYGLIVTTTFLVILPLECARIESDHSSSSSLMYSKSITLAFFVSLAGLTQLISPLIGLLSDHISIPKSYPENIQILGKRLPYLLLGTTLTAIGLLSQLYTSIFHLWGRYILAFFFNILGLTVLYSVMIALIPDLIPSSQVGEANGTWAFMLVLGSLCGFGLFYTVLKESLYGMYCLYTAVMLIACVITVVFVVDEEMERRKKKQKNIDEKIESDEESSKLSKETSPLLPSASVSETTKNTEKMTSTSSTYTEPIITQKENNQTKQHHRTKQKDISILDILRVMLSDPIQDMSCRTIRSSYTISPTTHFDFLIVTISRTFYYMAVSNQSFFLYFVHDVIGEHSNPEAAVSLLAIVGQMAGAITCYPVGIISDSYCHKRRRPFVYIACVIISCCQLALLACRDMKEMIVVCVVMGGANGVYLTMDTSLAVDTLDVNGEDSKDEIKDRDGNEVEEDTSGAAQLLGVWGVADFIGSALGPLVGGPLLYIFGSTTSAASTYSNNNDDDILDTITDGSYDESSFDTSTIQQGGSNGNWYAFEGYAAIMTMSAIYSLCSALSLLFIRKKGV